MKDMGENMGIAMCHFEMTCRDLGLAGNWSFSEPDIENLPELTKYVVRERKPENFFKFKAGKNFSRRNTCGILRMQFAPNTEIGEIGGFRSATM